MYEITIIFLLVVLSGCASKQYNERVKEIILHQTQEDLYEITRDHLRCYICEVKSNPIKVSNIEQFSPTIEYCKPIFKGKKFDSSLPGFSSSQITENVSAEFPGYIIFAFSERGYSFEEVRRNERDYSVTLPISHSELDCTIHELLSVQWKRKLKEHYEKKHKSE